MIPFRPARSDILRRSYDRQQAVVPTAVIMALLVTRAAMIEDVVYLMTKSLFDHLDLLPIRQPRISTSTRRLSVCGSRCIPARKCITANSAW